MKEMTKLKVKTLVKNENENENGEEKPVHEGSLSNELKEEKSLLTDANVESAEIEKSGSGIDRNTDKSAFYLEKKNDSEDNEQHGGNETRLDMPIEEEASDLSTHVPIEENSMVRKKAFVLGWYSYVIV